MINLTKEQNDIIKSNQADLIYVVTIHELNVASRNFSYNSIQYKPLITAISGFTHKLDLINKTINAPYISIQLSNIDQGNRISETYNLENYVNKNVVVKIGNNSIGLINIFEGTIRKITHNEISVNFECEDAVKEYLQTHINQGTTSSTSPIPNKFIPITYGRGYYAQGVMNTREASQETITINTGNNENVNHTKEYQSLIFDTVGLGTDTFQPIVEETIEEAFPEKNLQPENIAHKASMTLREGFSAPTDPDVLVDPRVGNTADLINQSVSCCFIWDEGNYHRVNMYNTPVGFMGYKYRYSNNEMTNEQYHLNFQTIKFKSDRTGLKIPIIKGLTHSEPSYILDQEIAEGFMDARFAEDSIGSHGNGYMKGIAECHTIRKPDQIKFVYTIDPYLQSEAEDAEVDMINYDEWKLILGNKLKIEDTMWDGDSNTGIFMMNPEGFESMQGDQVVYDWDYNDYITSSDYARGTVVESKALDAFRRVRKGLTFKFNKMNGSYECRTFVNARYLFTPPYLISDEDLYPILGYHNNFYIHYLADGDYYAQSVVGERGASQVIQQHYNFNLTDADQATDVNLRNCDAMRLPVDLESPIVKGKYVALNTSVGEHSYSAGSQYQFDITYGANIGSTDGNSDLDSLTHNLTGTLADKSHFPQWDSLDKFEELTFDINYDKAGSSGTNNNEHTASWGFVTHFTLHQVYGIDDCFNKKWASILQYGRKLESNSYCDPAFQTKNLLNQFGITAINTAQTNQNLVDGGWVGTDANDKSGWSYQIDEDKTIEEHLNNLFKETPLIPTINQNNEIDFKYVSTTYDILQYETPKTVIKINDIIKHKFSLTPQSEKIVPKLRVEYEYNHCSQQYEKFFPADQSYLMASELCTIGGNYQQPIISDVDKPLTLKLRHCQDSITAEKFAQHYLRLHCNQKLEAVIDLPISYLDYEVGDIVWFDKLINNNKAFGIDYTDNKIVHNGQQFFKFFMITSKTFSLNKITLKLIQMVNTTTNNEFIEDNMIRGCISPTATNYNPLATIDDASCNYISVCGDTSATNYNLDADGNHWEDLISLYNYNPNSQPLLDGNCNYNWNDYVDVGIETNVIPAEYRVTDTNTFTKPSDLIGEYNADFADEMINIYRVMNWSAVAFNANVFDLGIDNGNEYDVRINFTDVNIDGYSESDPNVQIPSVSIQLNNPVVNFLVKHDGEYKTIKSNDWGGHYSGNPVYVSMGDNGHVVHISIDVFKDMSYDDIARVFLEGVPSDEIIESRGGHILYNTTIGNIGAEDFIVYIIEVVFSGNIIVDIDGEDSLTLPIADQKKRFVHMIPISNLNEQLTGDLNTDGLITMEDVECMQHIVNNIEAGNEVPINCPDGSFVNYLNAFLHPAPNQFLINQESVALLNALIPIDEQNCFACNIVNCEGYQSPIVPLIYTNQNLCQELSIQETFTNCRIFSFDSAGDIMPNTLSNDPIIEGNYNNGRLEYNPIIHYSTSAGETDTLLYLIDINPVLIEFFNNIKNGGSYGTLNHILSNYSSWLDMEQAIMNNPDSTLNELFDVNQIKSFASDFLKLNNAKPIFKNFEFGWSGSYQQPEFLSYDVFDSYTASSMINGLKNLSPLKMYAYKNDGDIDYGNNIMPVELTIRAEIALASNPNLHNATTENSNINYYVNPQNMDNNLHRYRHLYLMDAYNFRILFNEILGDLQQKNYFSIMNKLFVKSIDPNNFKMANIAVTQQVDLSGTGLDKPTKLEFKPQKPINDNNDTF